MIELIDEAFESLFFGSGIWLGVLLFVILALSMCLKWKLSGVLIIPITLWMGIEYAQRLNVTSEQKYFWGMITMFLTTIFILINLIRDTK